MTTSKRDRHLHIVKDAPTDGDLCAVVVELLLPGRSAAQVAADDRQREMLRTAFGRGDAS